MPETSSYSTTVYGNAEGARIDISRVRFGDFNGDGLKDVYHINGWGASTADTIYLSVPGGSGVASAHEEIQTNINSWVNSNGDGASIDISRIRLADFNADGLTDVYIINGWGSSVADSIYYSNGDGSFTETTTSFTTSVYNNSPSSKLDISRLKFGDFNGDGLTDVYRVNGWGSSSADTIYINQGVVAGISTFNTVTTNINSWVNNTSDGSSIDVSRINLLDMNADGLTDVYIINGWGSSVADSIYYSNGDGTFTSSTTSYTTFVNNYAEGARIDISRLKFGDFNGDGLTDVYQVNGWGTSTADKIYLNKGEAVAGSSKFESVTSNIASWVNNTRDGASTDISRINLVDFNSDGLTDVYSINGWGTPVADTIYYSNGDGTFSPNATIYQTSIAGNVSSANIDISRFNFDDFNGDGLVDVYRINGWGNTLKDSIYQNTNGTDKVIALQNGPAPKTDIQYQLLTQGGGELYTPGNEAPEVSENKITPSIHVVESVTKGDGIGGVNASTYYYEDLRANKTGRGLEGFGKVIVTDTSTNTEVETHYAHRFPFTGLETYSEKRINGSKVESVVKYYVSKKTFPNATTFPKINVHYPVNYENISSTYNLSDTAANDTKQFYKRVSVKTGAFSVTLSDGSTNASACNTPGYACRGGSGTTINLEFPNIDDYGNIEWLQTKTEDATGNVWEKTTTSEYYPPDLVNWRLGRLKSAIVVHSAPGASNVTRKSAFTYNAEGQVETEMVEPGATDPTLTKITTYGYDDYGLKNEVTEQGWNKDGTPITRFAETVTTPVSMPNGEPAIQTTVYNAPVGSPLRASETTWTSALHGGQLKHQGPNGMVSSAEYDALGRKIKEINALNVVSTTQYAWTFSEPLNSLYKITKQTEGIQDDSTVYYDKLNREIRTTSRSLDGREVIKETVYNHRGLVDRANRPYLVGSTPIWLCFGYDDLGRVTSMNSPAANNGSPDCEGGNRAVSKTAYNGLETIYTSAPTEQYPAGVKKRETKFVTDKVKTVIEAYGQPEQSSLDYTYDAVGNLKTVTDSMGKVTTLHYDNNGRKTAMDDPTMGHWTYDYNSFDELTQQTDAKGQVVTMHYDVLGRMYQRVENNNQDVWNWTYGTVNSNTSGEKIGKLKQVSGPNGYLKQIKYDAKLQVGSTSETQTLPNGGGSETLTQSFTYDGYGRLATHTQPGGFTVENEYNRYGHLVAVKSPGVSITGEAYAKLQAQKAEAESKAAQAETLAKNYLSQAYSYQQKAIEYETYARALLQNKGYQIHADQFGGGDLEASTLFQAANDLRDISTRLIQQADQERQSAMTSTLAAISAADLDSATGHRKLATLEAQYASYKLEKAKQVVSQYKSGVSYWYGNYDYSGANSQLQKAEDMLNSAQLSYQNFQDQIALAERYEVYAAGIGRDISVGTAATTWWRAAAADPEGRVTKSIYGNGTVTERVYDPNTGHLTQLMTTDGVQVLQNLRYTYDNLDNVTKREDIVLQYDESYTYDALDRLKTATLNIPGLTGVPLPATRNYSYNKVGDIKTLGTKNLVYDEAALGTGRLTAVDGASLLYDNNGNITDLADGRTVTYTSFNKPAVLSKGSDQAEFIYNADRSRMLKINRSGVTVSKITRYFGGYEKITNKVTNEIEHRYQITAGGSIVAVHSKTDVNPAGTSNYLHKDALGSTDLITDDKAQLVERMGYTPFGTRRDMSQLNTASSYLSLSISAFSYTAVITKRGFTGHEHIDELDLIHMNGRVYDPGIGRFLSPDTIVQAPKDTQSYNRYAYVKNNPLKYTDPTGHSWLSSALKSVSRFVKSYGAQIASIAISIWAPWASPFLDGFTAGFVGGMIGTNGDFKASITAGLFAGISAAAANYIGHGAGGESLFDDIGQTAMAHGVSQGAITVMQGGKFKDGFLGGFVGHIIPMPKGLKEMGKTASGIAARTAFAAFAGGVAASFGGGKFKNGAVTAAFVRLYNDEFFVITDVEVIEMKNPKGSVDVIGFVPGGKGLKRYGKVLDNLKKSTSLEADTNSSVDVGGKYRSSHNELTVSTEPDISVSFPLSYVSPVVGVNSDGPFVGFDIGPFSGQVNVEVVENPGVRGYTIKGDDNILDFLSCGFAGDC